MKAILIARVSTEEQREAGNSLPAQVARLESYCQRKGFEIIQVCSFDESAYTEQREEFDRIIDFILSQKEKVDFHDKEFDKITREQKTLTKMTDNLYLDKLKGSITEADYDRFYQSFKDQSDDLSIRLDQLKEAEDNYYMTSKYVLDLTNRASDLFEGSEVEERRQLIKLVLSNLKVEGGKVRYDVQKPFDLLVKAGEEKGWPCHTKLGTSVVWCAW